MAKRQEMYTHAHRPYRITPMPRRTPRHNMVGRIPCTRFSTQHSALSYTSEQRSYHLTRWHFPLLRGRSTCPLHSYKVEIACMRSITWHPPWAPSNILPYPTPQSRYPHGHLAWDLPNSGAALSPHDEPHSYLSKDCLYIIYVQPSKFFFRKFGSIIRLAQGNHS